MSVISRLQSIISQRTAGFDPTTDQPQDVFEPSVLLIVAGGTICMQDSADGLVTSRLFLDECLSPKPTFNDGTVCPTSRVIDEHGVGRDVPVLRLPRDRNGANVRCAVLEFNPLLDSSTAHAPTWNQLGCCVRSNEDSYDAFVICHGTDTLAYTAAALSFTLMPHLSKMVILTGAQRSMFFADSDGADNLLGSIVLASHVRIPEVCVYFGHKLLRGSRITKISSSNYSGFESPNAGPLATVTETGIVVHWDNLQHKTSNPQTTTPDLPILDSSCAAIIKIYPGLTPALLEIILSAPGIRGIVLETFGSGNVPLPLIPVLSAAVGRGLVIVNVTQCLHGSVSVAYAPARKLAEAGIRPGHDMTSEAAYAKLVYVLSSPYDETLDAGKAADMMESDLRGEITPPENSSVATKFESIAQLPIRYERTISGHNFLENRLR